MTLNENVNSAADDQKTELADGVAGEGVALSDEDLEQVSGGSAPDLAQVSGDNVPDLEQVGSGTSHVLASESGNIHVPITGSISVNLPLMGELVNLDVTLGIDLTSENS